MSGAVDPSRRLIAATTIGLSFAFHFPAASAAGGLVSPASSA
jgi:hypothetical protein